jgi:CBS-domain-containing membrane protein
MRAAALIVGGYGFWLILGGSGMNGIWVAVMGAAFWTAGAWIQQRSCDFRLLVATPAGKIMSVDVVRVPASWSVARVQRSIAGVDCPTYVLTIQDGRDCGIVLTEQIRAIRESEAHYTPMYCVTRPISYAKCVRIDDPALHAFELLQRGRDPFVAVLDRLDLVAGVITSDELARALAQSVSLNPPAAVRRDQSELKLAA